MSYANRKEIGSNRTVAIVIVALIHVLLGYVLVSGLAYNVVKKAAEDLKTFDVEDEPPLVRTIVQPPQIQTTPVIQPAPVITPRADPVPPAPPAPPPPPRKVQTARAKGSLPGLFSTDDYPSSAIRDEEQGTVSVRLTIGTDGRVSDCNVTSSSGSRALDSTTCSILKRRARYTPAKDETGRNVTDTDTARIRWQLPED